jgi:hypothetical protein
VLRKYLNPEEEEYKEKGENRKLKSSIIYIFDAVLKCDEIQVDERGKICSTNGNMSSAYTLLTGKPGREIPLAGTLFEYEDSFSTEIKELPW